MHENIVRLEISVHDIILWKHFECLDHLSEINERSFLRKRSFFLHDFIQCSSITKFIYEIKVIDSFEHINILNNVGTSLDGRKDVNFIDCALFEFRYLFEFVSVDNFNCHLKFCFHVHCLVNFSVHSLAELFLHRVVLDYLPHFLYYYLNKNLNYYRSPVIITRFTLFQLKFKAIK